MTSPVAARLLQGPGAERLLDVVLAVAAFVGVFIEAAIVIVSTTPAGPGTGGRRHGPDDFGGWEDRAASHANDLGPGVLLLVVLVATLAGAGVLVRRRWPEWGAALAGAAALLGAFVLGLPVAVSLAFALVTYSFAVERGLLPGVLLATAGMVAVVVAAATSGADEGAGLVLVYLLTAVAVPLLAAAATRSRRAYLREVEDRLRRAERERRAETSRALADERVRLARDLHDVLAHSLTVVNLQVSVASTLLESHPDRAAQALAEARAAGTEAVAELRGTLALLRGDESEQRAPVPGLTDLPELVERVRSTGVPVTLASDLDSTPDVSSAVGIVAYRVVQEGLTNVVKHAGGAASEVTLALRDGWLFVAVANAAPSEPIPATTPGIGLEGLRERVAALGGQFAAGPYADGGFIVQADLPAHAHSNDENVEGP